MKQEKKLLEVGDVVYLVNSKTNDIRKLEIIKTTKLLACYDIYVYGDRLRKEVINGKVDIYGGFKESHINYYLPTPELTQQYQEKQTRLKIQELIEEEIELKTLTLPQLLSIQSILQNQPTPTPPLVEWVDSANYNPHNIGDSGMVGLGEDGVVWSGNFTYSESEGWSIAIYKGDGYKYVKITHIILKSNLLHLPKK